MLPPDVLPALMIAIVLIPQILRRRSNLGYYL
jgi:hypothetical protein